MNVFYEYCNMHIMQEPGRMSSPTMCKGKYLLKLQSIDRSRTTIKIYFRWEAFKDNLKLYYEDI